jgi:hypothetical protein
MKTTLLFCLFWLVAFCSFSQDTLFFKNSVKSVVIVKEISPTEVQYKKIDMPDGPVYIVERNDIEKIVFRNGTTEALNQPANAGSQTPASGDKPFVVEAETQYNINTQKITLADTRRRYSAMVNLANAHPDPERRGPLVKMAGQLRSLKRHERGSRTCAIVFGGFALAGVGLYALTSDVSSSAADNSLSIPPVILGSVAVAFAAASITVHVSLNKKRRTFVKMYNE